MVASIYSNNPVNGIGDSYKPLDLGSIVRRVVDEHNKWADNLRKTTDKAVRDRVNNELAASQRKLEEEVLAMEPGRAENLLNMLENRAVGMQDHGAAEKLRLHIQRLKDRIPKSPN